MAYLAKVRTRITLSTETRRLFSVAIPVGRVRLVRMRPGGPTGTTAELEFSRTALERMGFLACRALVLVAARVAFALGRRLTLEVESA